MGPCHFEPCANDSVEDGDNGDVGEDEHAGRMFTTDWQVLFFRLLSPTTKWKGDIGMGAVCPSFRPSVRPSVTFRFRSRTQKP